jgi:hypothetical protein
LLGAAGAPVIEADQRRQTLGHHIVGAATMQVSHEGDTTSVTFTLGVV